MGKSAVNHGKQNAVSGQTHDFHIFRFKLALNNACEDVIDYERGRYGDSKIFRVLIGGGLPKYFSHFPEIWANFKNYVNASIPKDFMRN